MILEKNPLKKEEPVVLELEIPDAVSSGTPFMAIKKEDSLLSKVKQEDLLELPESKAAMTTFPPGCIVLYTDSSTSIVTMGVVFQIFIDLSTREFVYSLTSSTNARQLKESILARQEELQFGPSCPVWARPLHLHEEEDELPAVIIGSSEDESGMSFSIQEAIGPERKYHGIPASNIRFRADDVSILCDDDKLAQPKREADAVETLVQSVLDEPERSKVQEDTSTVGCPVVAKSEILTDYVEFQLCAVERPPEPAKRRVSEESAVAPTPPSSPPRKRFKTMAEQEQASEVIVDDSSVTFSSESASATETTSQPPPSVAVGLTVSSPPVAAAAAAAPNPHESIPSSTIAPYGYDTMGCGPRVSETIHIPRILDPFSLPKILVGDNGCILEELQVTYRCSISLHGLPFTKSRQPPRVTVTGQGPNVDACVGRIEDLVVESASRCDKGRLLFELAKTNDYHKRDRQVYWQRSFRSSNMTWMFAQDLPPHSNQYLKLFVGQDGQSIKEIEQQTACRVEIENSGQVPYFIITGPNSHLCNRCVTLVLDKLAWAESKYFRGMC